MAKEYDGIHTPLPERETGILGIASDLLDCIMSLEEHKAIIRRWFEAENNKVLALLDESVALDFVDHSYQLKDLEEYERFIT